MKHLPLIVIVSLAGVACEQRPEGDTGSIKPLDPLLNVMDVNVARVVLAEPCAVSVVTEFEQSRSEVLVGAKFERDFRVAVQPDDESGRMRIAIGDSQSASSVTLEENPFGNRGWVFHHTPRDDGEGRFIIMESDPNTPPIERIVVVTEPPRPNRVPVTDS